MAQVVLSSMCTSMTLMGSIMRTSGHMVIVFDEAMYLNNAMLISFYLFIEVVGLDLG